MKNPISLDGLIDWLERQDPNEEYDFLDIHDCLCCRYFRSIGLPVASVTPSYWFDHDNHAHRYPWELNNVANIGAGARNAYATDGSAQIFYTYGAALKAAKKELTA